MRDKLNDLHGEFQQERGAALLDALALCREQSLAVPAWIIDALLARRDAIVLALEPPTQTIRPAGIDSVSWGDLYTELVPAGTGWKIVGGRRRKEIQRENARPLVEFVRQQYRLVVARVGRVRAITALHADARAAGFSVSRDTIERIAGKLHIHRRTR